jgi:hypothetical protein
MASFMVAGEQLVEGPIRVPPMLIMLVLKMLAISPPYRAGEHAAPPCFCVPAARFAIGQDVHDLLF